MNINTVAVQSHVEHGLRANFSNVLYTNSDTKDTVMETSCYSQDTNTMEATIDNDGFETRMGFFRYDTGEVEAGKKKFAYKKTPVTFIGKKF